MTETDSTLNLEFSSLVFVLPMLSALCAVPFLDMACQTIIRYIVLGMTAHAPAHGHLYPWFRRRLFTLSDLPVTGLAGDLSQHHMPAVRKEDMIRLFVYSFPGDFPAFLLKDPDLFLFRRLRHRLLMAFQARVDVRHPGEGLGFEEAVACVTPQSLFDMLFMIERDRLVTLGAKAEVDKKKE